MRFDFEALEPAICYKLMTSTVTPRPIAWVTTKSSAGIVNAAPYSFFNVVGHTPPTAVIGLLRDPERGFKDTARNILETGEFVINLVSETLAEKMNVTAIDAPADVSEIELAGLATAPCEAVAPPRLLDAPVSFECTSLSSVVTGPFQTLVIASIHAAHINDQYVLDAQRGHVDTPKLGLIGRMHGSGWYARTSDLFEMARPSWQQHQAGKP